MRARLLPVLVAIAAPAAAPAQPAVATAAALKHYDVTIRRFDPTRGAADGQTFVLPVDSPDEDHAIASTIANAASFSRKADGGRALPVAFMAVKIVPRAMPPGR